MLGEFARQPFTWVLYMTRSRNDPRYFLRNFYANEIHILILWPRFSKIKDVQTIECNFNLFSLIVRYLIRVFCRWWSKLKDSMGETHLTKKIFEMFTF